MFTPICLEQQIQPCRSLCESIKKGCEIKMNAHNYQWPAIFDCSRFPEDNGLCIPPESTKIESTKSNIIKSKETIKPNTNKLSNTKLKVKLNDKCHGCSESIDKELVLQKLCQSDIGILNYI